MAQSDTRAGVLPAFCSGWYTARTASAGDHRKSVTPSSFSDFLSSSDMSGAS
jgi:hypothetical protein